MRVIALVDMDCFYCQVEEKLNPELQGKPVAVVQYNLWREGGIIAANYLAKDKGVTKGMWKHEAKDLCPDIQFARVAELRGRADLTKYREAGSQVVDALSTFPIHLERASIDEAYLDLTEAVQGELAKGISNIPLDKLQTTHIVGHKTVDFISSISNNQDTDGFCEDDLKLAVGGIIVEKMRSYIYEKTGYRCSAGIAQNKILAKLVCGLHKPNKQTILPGNAILQFLAELPLRKIKRLGGKFGRKVSEELNISTVGELFRYSQEELRRKFDFKTGRWLYNIARGVDNEPVQPKLLSKSISCCKRFPGKNALFKEKDVHYWINELALEVSQRLATDQEQHSRKAKMATLSFVHCVSSKDVNVSKTFTLRSYEASVISQDALEILNKFCHKANGFYYLKYLGISVGNFECLKNIKDIKYFFQKKNKHLERVSDNIISSEFIGVKNVKEEEREEKCQLEDIQNLLEKGNVKMVEDLNCDKSPEILKSTNIKKENEDEFGDSSEDAYYNLIHSDKKVESNFEEMDNSEEENCSFHSGSEEEIPENDIEHSFFIKYFNAKAEENVRNFQEESLPVQLNEQHHEYSSSMNSENDDNEDRKSLECKECGIVIISADDISSHMDYHFALRIHEQDISTGNGNFGQTPDHSLKKRKVGETGNGPVTSTINEETVTEASELCEICNQNINISEMSSHCDYHTAKNLEQIWNAPNKSCDSLVNKKNEKVLSNSILRYLERNTR